MKCKNCEAELVNVNGFCQNCGARVIHDRISLKFLFKEFMDKVLSYDNKLFKTFFHLFTKPELVIDSYISGVRKRYYNPVSYLLISITLAGIYLFFFKDVAIESIGTTFQEQDPNNPFNDEEFMKDYFSFFTDYQALVTALIIPIYAFVSWVVFLNRKKYNFYEHIVIYLYANSQTSIISFFVILPIYFYDQVLAGELFLYSSLLFLVYAAYVLVRLFKLTIGQFIIKTLYFGLIGSVIFLILVIGIAISMLFSLTPEQIKQYQKQQDSIRKVQQLDILKMEKDSTKTKILVPR